MEIKLIRLTLENFKGLKAFEFVPDGKNATILGDNATGFGKFNTITGKVSMNSELVKKRR